MTTQFMFTFHLYESISMQSYKKFFETFAVLQ